MSNNVSPEGPQGFPHLGPLPPYLAERPFPRIFQHLEREEKARAVPCADIVEHLRGEPTFMKPKEWRWGSHGSLSVSLEKNCYFDHEANEGGDTIKFVEREFGYNREDAIAWLLDSKNSSAAAAAGKSVVHRPPPRLGRIVATYDYLSESGLLLSQVVRGDPKGFRQRRPDGQGGWSWSVQGVPAVPYRLPELIKDVGENRTIVIVEGEKDVDTLRKHGIPATCNAGGAGKWRNELSSHLRGADVVLVPDNDIAGRDHMNKVGMALARIAARIRVLELPNLQNKGDVSDWLAAGGTPKMLLELITKAPRWEARAPFQLTESMGKSSGEPETEYRQESSGRQQGQQGHANAQQKSEQEQTKKEKENPSDGEAQTSEQERASREGDRPNGTEEAELIDELAKLDSISYGRRRKEAARQIGIRFSELDAAVKQRRAKLEQGQREAEEKANRNKEPFGKRGFTTNEHGLWWRDSDGPRHLAGQFQVRATTRDPHSSNWGVLIVWRDQDGQEHSWVMPRAMLAGDATEVFRYFLDGGLFISPNRKCRDKLIEYLMLCDPLRRARCVDRTGWYGEQNKACYVFPDGEIIGPEDAEEIALQTPSPLRGPTIAGDLEGWKTSIAASCTGNSRAITAVSLSLAGPLLGPLGEEFFGIHFEGKSSIGKTGLARLAVSAWGTELRTWRTTDNSAESWCAAANDGLLTLDEISQGDARSIDALAYMLAAGTGKGRANRSGIARPIATWRIAFLSTGEIGLGEKLAEAGRRVRAGQLVRVIEVPAEADAGLGVFEELHDFATGAALADAIKAATAQHTGHAARAFIAGIADRLPVVMVTLKKARAKWIHDHMPDKADGEVQRVAAKFALIGSAGELAGTILELPWPKNAANDAAAACFKAWLEKRGGSEAHEIVAGIAQVRRFIGQYGESRFSVITGKDNQTNDLYTINNRAGWRRHSDPEDFQSPWEYFVLPGAWKTGSVPASMPALSLGHLLPKGSCYSTPAARPRPQSRSRDNRRCGFIG